MSLAPTSAPDVKEQTEGALQALPADQATALLLAARPGVTYRDVAMRLGVEPAVVLRWLSDGLRSLRPTAATATSGIAWS